MLDSLEEKLLLIHMEAGVVMEVVPSLVRMQPKLTEVEPIRLDR